MNMTILGVALVVALALAVLARNVYLNKKLKKEQEKKRKEAEAINKANAEAWPTDYRNPDSPNYDPVRAEQDLQAFLDKLK